MMGAPHLKGLDIEEKLMNHKATDPVTGCWRWTRGHSSWGYGHISGWSSTQRVHRIAHILWIGPIPEGYTVDHVYARGCRHLDCFNPAHLEAVPIAENLRRAERQLSTMNARKTHCPQGHEYTPENTAIRNYGHPCRMCKTCHREHQRAYMAKRKAEG